MEITKWNLFYELTQLYMILIINKMLKGDAKFFLSKELYNDIRKVHVIFWSIITETRDSLQSHNNSLINKNMGQDKQRQKLKTSKNSMAMNTQHIIWITVKALLSEKLIELSAFINFFMKNSY